MEFETAGPPHVAPESTVGKVMRQVLYALIPGTLVQIWIFGPGLLVQLMIAVSAALVMEAVMLHLRKQPLRLFLSDGSVVVTAWLFCLCLPPVVSWWVPVVGMLFAIVVAKHLYGGLGHNVFNPAMVGYVVVLVAFPVQATLWPDPTPLPDISTTLAVIFTDFPTAAPVWDAITQATPLDQTRAAGVANVSVTELRETGALNLWTSHSPAWIALAWLAGGIWLWQRGVIGWRVSLGVLGGAFLIAAIGWLLNPGDSLTPSQHLLFGSLMLGAFFIATDPVSGASTPRGRLVFGAGVAIITLSIRAFGAYPDGLAFAVLLMNAAVPIIDRYTRPRVYGH